MSSRFRLPKLSNCAQSAQTISLCRLSRFSAWLFPRITDVSIYLKYTKIFSQNIINGLNHKTSFLKGVSKCCRAIIFFLWLFASFCIFNYDTVFTLQRELLFWTTVLINKLSHWKPLNRVAEQQKYLLHASEAYETKVPGSFVPLQNKFWRIK